MTPLDDPLAAWDSKVGVPALSVMPAHHPIQRLALKPHAEEDKRRAPGLYAFFEARRISSETVDLFGIYAHQWIFTGEMEAKPALVFPYRAKGREVSRAYRHRSRDAFDYELSAEPALFNFDEIQTPDEVIWADREIGVMALREAGYVQVTCLPGQEAGAARMLAIEAHADFLSKVAKIKLALSDNEQGAAVREELARRFGRHRCWMVEWPPGCHSAEEVLQKHGPEKVQECVEAATPYPIAGVYHIQPGTLEAYRSEPQPPLMTTGLSTLDKVLHLPSDGRLIVTTGFPGSGKSSLIRFLMVHTAIEHDRRWMVFSPEMSPWKKFAASVAEVRVGAPFRERHGRAAMPLTAVRFAEQWMRSRFVFLAADAEGEAPTVEWILDRTRLEVMRFGVTDLLIDPWNQVSHDFGRMNETQYIERQLQIIAGFGQRHGVNTWIVAHPIKPSNFKVGEDGPPPPTLYDIAGSATWFNRADIGLVVHRPPGKNTQIILRKSRFDEWGEKGAEAEAEYEKWCGRFVVPHGKLFTEEDEN